MEKIKLDRLAKFTIANNGVASQFQLLMANRPKKLRGVFDVDNNPLKFSYTELSGYITVRIDISVIYVSL